MPPLTPSAPELRGAPLLCRAPWRELCLGAALFIAVLVVYGPALRGGFVIDDRVNVTPPDLQSVAGLWRIWSQLGATQQYYPFLYSAYWLEHRLWGDATTGYHLVNVFMHATSACLLAAILMRLRLRGAWLAAFVFALHPIAVESVAWIAEQKNTLSTALCLASAYCYLRFDDDRRRSTYALSSFFFLAAVLSKTVTATLPAALLVVLWWRRGGLSFARDVAPLVPWLVSGVGMGIFSAWVERRYVGASGAEFAWTLSERGLVAARAVWFYVGKIVFPVELQFMYPQWHFDAERIAWFASAAGSLLLAVMLVYLAARRKRGPLAVALLFLGLLAPMLGFLNIYWFIVSFVADHFAYLPSVALIGGGAACIASFQEKQTPQLRRAGACVSVALVVILGLQAWRHSRIFRDYETLCRTTLAQNPEAWLLHHNLGVELAASPERMPEAIARLRETVRLQPSFADGHFNLARALQHSPDTAPEAIAEYREALRLNPRDLDARLNLARLLAIQGDGSAAIAEYETALAQQPRNAEAHYQLGCMLLSTPNQAAKAVEHLRIARELAPTSLDANFKLGNALAAAGQRDGAIAAFENALRLKPDLVEAHYNLGCLLAEVAGRVGEARLHLRAALELRPGFEPAAKMLHRLPEQ